MSKWRVYQKFATRTVITNAFIIWLHLEPVCSRCIMGNESPVALLCSFSFFPARILLREQRFRDSRINSHFKRQILPEVSRGWYVDFIKTIIYHLISRIFSDGSVFAFIFVKEMRKAIALLSSARGVGDLKGVSEPVELDTEMRRNQGVIWQNIVHQSIPKHV